MGERGPKPLPANVHLLRNNASKKPLAALLDEAVRPNVEIPECPDHFDDEARAEWNRITVHLYLLGLISALDRGALSAYCTAWSRYVLAETRIKELGQAALVQVTPNGFQQIGAWVTVSNRSQEMMAKFLAMFGMSPADRTRVTPSDATGAPLVSEGTQGELPGVDPAPEAGGWGNFK